MPKQGDGKFEQLLLRMPELKQLRHFACGKLRALLARARDECTWCGTDLPKGKQAHCSRECMHEVYVRCLNGYRRTYIRKRDKWTCQLCGATPSTSQVWKETWEADHTIPISWGGGMCGEDNLRCLCGTCHRKETTRLLRELRAKECQGNEG